jgi:Abnormal spindle-like microcephaly-assoc'd, ASPM-SPD-2-Hydin/Transmembrane protein 131-like N-terminal/Right handed beta helix region
MIPVRSRAVFQLCFVLLLISTTAIAQNTIHVPADQPTIQAAINAASPGDTVLVASGTYFENINFNGKAITVTSSDGAATTIIDGNAAGTVVTFNHNETAGAVLNGFTIRNGHAYDGAGIYILNASPKITNNVITGNGGLDGIGILSRDGSPLIQGNTVTGNVENMGSGGGGGAGIHITGTYGVTSNTTVSGNLVTNNHLDAGGFGAGIFVDYYASALIENNYVAGNTGYNGGGGLGARSNARVTIVGNVIVNNSSGEGGGFYDDSNGPLLFLNNTLYGNTSSGGGSEIATIQYYTLNSIFKNNIVYATSGIAVTCSDINALTATNNIVYSISPATNGNCAAFADYNGNIFDEPGIVNPAGGDFHLHVGSPAIDAGVTDPNLPEKDQDGTTRVLDGNNDGIAAVDIGAFELVSGGAPAGWAALTPAGATFPTTVVGSSSGPITFTLLNTGNAALTISSISLNSAFAQVNNCPPTLPIKASCLIQVTFTPTAAGTFSSALSIATDGGNGTVTVPLSGTGTTLPAASLSVSQIDFGSVSVGSSTLRTFSVTNTGGSPLRLTNVTIVGPPFSLSLVNCPSATLQPGSSCTLGVTFAPTQAGVFNDVVRLYDNAPDSPQTVTVTGNTGAPAIAISPTALAFGTVIVGTSRTQAVTISNTGDAPLTLLAISTAPPFSESSNCSSVAIGASCTIYVNFTPSAAQDYTGILTISSNANTGHDTKYVSLSGTGGTLAVSISPSSLDFGQQLVGVTSTPQMVFISNSGSIDVNIGTISLTGANFQQTNNCPAKLAPIQGCTVTLTFTPSSLGTSNGSLTITHDAPGSPAIVSLSGSGLAPVASLSTTSLTFTTQRVGTTSPSQVVTLSNTGNAALTVSSVTSSDPIVFVQSRNCPSILGIGSSCSISVRFQPQQSGTVSANLVIVDDSGRVSGSTQTVSLTGTGGTSIEALSTSSLTFATTKVGTSATAAAVAITNSGTMSLNISSIVISGDFSQSNTCGSPVAPGSSCVVNVVFTPIATGLRSGTLTINSDAQNGAMQTVSLSGTGAAPLASITPGTLTFATIPVGTQTNGSPVTVTNVGDAPMSITSIATTGDFLQSNNCSTTLPIGSSCVIYVWFVPTAAGLRTGVLTITDDAATSPQTVSLSGSATDFDVTVSPTSVSINPNQNASYNVTVSAVGGVWNQSVLLICSGLPAGATCTFIPASLNPGSTSQTAKLKIITSNGGAPSGTYTIVVTGMVGNVVHSATATLIVK